MQPSSNSPFPRTAITTPRGSAITVPENTGSPRRESLQPTPRSPNVHPQFDIELKMNDFYTIDQCFRSLDEALKPTAKGSAAFAPAPVLLELRKTIQRKMLTAEQAFKLRDYPNCLLHVRAAKSDQVRMLGAIDGTPVEDMPAARRGALHIACKALGTGLSERLIKAERKADAVEQEAERIRKKDDSDDDITFPSSPSGTMMTRRGDAVSPSRGSHKRVPGDAESPVLAQSPSKRKKTEATLEAPSGKPIAASTSSTTTTAAVQSPPSYKPVPQLRIEPKTDLGTPSGPGSDAGTSAPDSPATPISPRKMRPLAPQAKPRPRSQLFTAPLEFTNEAPEGLTSKAVPAALKPVDVAGQRLSDAGRGDQHS